MGSVGKVCGPVLNSSESSSGTIRSRGLRTLPLSLCLIAFASGCSIFHGVVTNAKESAVMAEARQKETVEAVAVVQRMAEFLAARPTLLFEAEIAYDAVQASGQKIEFGSHRRISILRPDHARMETTHRDGTRELITFDGRRLSAAAPDDHAYASIPFVGDAGQALDLLENEYALVSPLSELLRADLAGTVTARVISGRRIGRAMIDGIRCLHLAFEGEIVDFQLFIQDGESPLPIRFLVDYHEADGSPQFQATFHDWEIEPWLADSYFRFEPAVGSQRVDFEELVELAHGRVAAEGDER